MKAIKDHNEFHIAAVGASAGGLEAIELFFEKMPLDTGIGFVVVQHLSPDFKSHMAELLGRKTELPIHRAEEGLRVEPNAIYLIPPKKEMSIVEGKLLLTDRSADFSHPIDQFFRALAADIGRYAIGVILSGTGSDGSRGIRDIAEAGGLVLAQDEASAKFDGMPLNAQGTGLVDVVLNPEGMGEALVQYVHEGLSKEALAERELLTNSTGVQKIFEILKVHSGIDFSYYKETTIGRRIHRRMQLERINDIETYKQRLLDDPGEISDLYYDLLIGVTKFFRDKAAFEALRDVVIPEIFEKHTDGEPVRVWIAACATGEEAYSVAILLEEHIRKNRLKVDYKLFATDIHKEALQKAAEGSYSEDHIAGVSKEYRERYFRKRKSQYIIIRDLRQKIVFAPHNVFNDAPFTQIDLICCRNMLIYFQPHAQRKTLSLFHFSLKAGGIMVLGPSETPGDLQDEFQNVDKRWRVYRKRRDVRLPLETRQPFRSARLSTGVVMSGSGRQEQTDHRLLGTYERLLSENMPPSLLVDEKRELVQTFGGAERFLRHRGGRHSAKLLDIIDDKLRTPVAGAMTHAVKDDTEVRYSGIAVNGENSQEQVRLVVKPIHDHVSKVTSLLIRFEPMVEAPLLAEPKEGSVDLAGLSEERIESLETELRFTRENLQATIEELETSNEELQATNEEMIASNEELQSTNEELQSVNEELFTVNVEHQKRIDELAESTNDMDNLLATTRVGVIFIDDELSLRRYTPEVGRMFHLMPQDVGRPIVSFKSNLNYDEFEQDLVTVLESGREVEREISDRNGVPYLARLLPYRTKEGITGIVMTLIDVTALHKAQLAIDRFKHMVEKSTDAHVFLDESGRVLYGNPTMSMVSGKSVEELCKLNFIDIDSEMTPKRFAEITYQTKIGSVPPHHWTLRGPDGETKLEVAITGVQIGDRWLLFAIGRDITEKELERKKLIKARKAAEAANAAKSSFLANMSHEIRTPLSAILGFAEVIEKTSEESEQVKNAGTIRSNGEHLLAVVNDVLDLSKIEADKLEFQWQTASTETLLNDVQALMTVRAEAKGLPLELVYKSEIPETLSTDPMRFRQIMLNLIGNAIKFTETGKVQIAVSSDKSNLIIEVVDTGSGMSELDQEKLFRPFTQADSTVSKRIGGTGLGLAICKRLCGVLGGTIRVDSEEGVGSTFRVELPLSETVDINFIMPEAAPTKSQHPDKPTPLEGLENRQILVADDRRDVWRVVEFFLSQAGATVTIASDGREAVDIVLQHGTDYFDLVFMDIQMPVMNGYEAVRELRREGCSMPIVALTAGAMKGERDACMDAGCDDYLTKPIDADELVATARRLIAKQKSEAFDG